MSLLGAVAGDIWSTGAFSFESPLKELLDSGEYTLEQLLAEDELLQELRGVHPQLIHFFSTPEAVTKLVEYVILPLQQQHQQHQTTETEKEANGNKVEQEQQQEQHQQQQTNKPREPGEWLNQHLEQTEASGGKSKTPEKDPEMKHIRFPYMACEIICCEIQPIIDILVDGKVPLPEPPNTTTMTCSASQQQQEEKEETSPEPAEAAKEEQTAEEPTTCTTTTTTTEEPTTEEEQTKVEPKEEEEQTTEQPRTRILDLLFSVLYDTRPGDLDDYRAGYFDKILTVLFRKRAEDLSKYINEGGSRGTEDLMKALFGHLYSHSVMQIAQRLMLPQRPTPPQPPSEEDGAEIMSEEQGIPDEDPPVFSDWSKSGVALDMLLDSLIDPQVPSSSELGEEELQERRLDLSLNASEVLITVIQNSMLSSETMLSLTSMDTIQRVVTAATTLRPQTNDEEPYFSPHESLLTSSMNVLESLILQLGGYGAVGTMFLLPEEEMQQQNEQQDESEQPSNLIADLESMVAHLPQLLDAMANLLRHPSTKKWVSPMQFSKAEPQQLLGSSRLRIVRVLESLVLLGDPEIDSKLVQSDCLEICLDLFWEFQWCSMLHQSVANLLVHVFEGQNARIEMQEYFLIKCNLLGRLMDSFLEIQESARIADVVMNLKDMNLTSNSAVPSSAASERGSASDPLPISEDDVEAALEKQEEAEMAGEAPPDVAKVEVSNVEQVSTEAVRFESRDASTIGIAAPAQAFRYGYMGHVIIICQALVHACSNEMEQDEENMLDNGDPENEVLVAENNPNPEPLLLAELVTNHTLADRWHEFISSILASETAIQSTPLGGYSTGSNHDPLHSHRPGLADDGDMGDDGMGPPAPPRGMLGGGDVIDMDDNDLEIAASMMAGLSLQRPTADVDSGGESTDSGSLESGDSEKSYNSGETAKDRTGYAFDDPLGKAGALGIELGKLTQYKEGEDDDKGPAGEDDESGSSSDEEPDTQAEGAGGDVPVMDLFAGNFDYNQDGGDAANAEPVEGNSTENWSNFANFEQVGEPFGGDTTPEPVVQGGSDESPSKKPSIDDIFGQGDHAVLLEDSTPEKEAAPAEHSVQTEPVEDTNIELLPETADAVADDSGAPNLEETGPLCSSQDADESPAEPSADQAPADPDKEEAQETPASPETSPAS